MELTPELIESARSAVLTPGLASMLWLATISFVGELVIQLPTSILFASQLLLYEDPLSFVFFIQLLLMVALPISIGTALGSMAAYGIAYWGGKPAIEKFKKYIRFSWADVEKLEAKFKSNWYDELLFLALRSAPLTPTLPINIVAGVLRMRPSRYVLLTILGTVIRMMIMLVVFGLGGGNVLMEILDL